MPISARWPTAAMGGALVKTSASGPMPTSRYCDHMRRSMSCCLSAIACSEPGLRRRKIVADRSLDLGADRRRPFGVAARLFLDHPLEHGHGEGDARRLDRLQIGRRQQPGLGRIAAFARRVGKDIGEQADRLAGGVAGERGRLRRLAEVAHRRRHSADIDQFGAMQGDDRRPLELRAPDAADEGGVLRVVRKGEVRAGIERHLVVSPSFRSASDWHVSVSAVPRQVRGRHFGGLTGATSWPPCNTLRFDIAARCADGPIGRSV